MSRDAFANYDFWLEAPYQQMQAEQEAFENWCDNHGFDPDGDGVWDAYEEWCDDYEPEEPDPYYDYEESDWDDVYYNELSLTERD